MALTTAICAELFDDRVILRANCRRIHAEAETAKEDCVANVLKNDRVWIACLKNFPGENIDLTMDDRFRKVSCNATADIAPPILLRRRLSTPETIMRKHILAQQRSSSQESNRSQNSDTTQSCNWPLNASSDPNLNRKRDTDIRKSILIKRFWENSKLLPFPRTYAEWQYSFGKAKLGSPHSTPEHISRNSIFEMSPKHQKLNPKTTTPNRKISVYDVDTTSKDSIEDSPTHKPQENPAGEDLDEAYIVYSSNFSNATSTDSAEQTSRTIEEHTTPTIQSDSAYTNGFSSAPNATPEAKPSVTTYHVNSKNVNTSENTHFSELPIKYQFVVRENSKDSQTSYEFLRKDSLENQPKPSNDSSTQTGETTNLNVISNVHLSESTLNLIFNQVMNDLFQNKPEVPEAAEPKLIKVQNCPTFNITKTADPPDSKADKKPLITEMNVGSPYKTKNSPLVPRLSALPRSSSMEVNISSNDSFDKESDTSSLVDSLDEPISPKDGKFNHDDKLVRGELALLPDNSNIKMKDLKKSSVFYIPMKNEDMKVIEEEPKTSDVSSLLPNRLKEKLMKRQMKRQEKKKENKLRSFEKLDSENGNVHPYFTTSPHIKVKHKKKETILPHIENKNQKERLPDIEKEKHYKPTPPQTSVTKTKEHTDQLKSKPKSFWLPKSRQYIKQEKLTPITTKTEKDSNPKKSQKQIEILEIMEIVEPERLLNMNPKVKSRIPVLVQHSKASPQKDYKQTKSPYLDFTVAENDSKLDQLIANILIDSLHRDDEMLVSENERMKNAHSTPKENEQRTDANLANNNNTNLVETAADLLTKQVLENNNLDQNYEVTKNLEDKEKVDNSKIPKGWITFYMLQTNNSPDSTSDEGPNTMAIPITKSTQLPSNKYYAKPKKNEPKETNKDSDYKSEDYFESDWEVEPKYKQRRVRNERQDKCGWSVTVSGTANGQQGPDLEMRLKFPQLNNQNVGKMKNRSDVGVQKGISSTFPPLSNNKIRHSDSAFTFEDVCSNKRTTEITKSKQYLKKYESTPFPDSVVPSKYEPRPTKTSKQRCMLNRPTNRHHEIMAPIDNRNRNVQDILDKFPVSGNAVCHVKSVNMSSLSEKNLKRILSQLSNQNIP